VFVGREVNEGWTKIRVFLNGGEKNIHSIMNVDIRIYCSYLTVFSQN
jgi:hypothetical protein